MRAWGRRGPAVQNGKYMDYSKTIDASRLEEQARILEERQKQVRAEFIEVELDLATTFSQIALSSGDREKIERNEAHAQEAHESALRFWSTVQIGEPLQREIEEKLKHLRKLLEEVKKKRSASARAL